MHEYKLIIHINIYIIVHLSFFYSPSTLCVSECMLFVVFLSLRIDILQSLVFVSVSFYKEESRVQWCHGLRGDLFLLVRR